ncbi:MAG TPA: CoA transferase [Candidatus Acidoferrales bacterium]|jgi:crotonobetainyl-CoA:carnitine CoA-transferase CaiB-like acyl-CoA transferase|nr:CoA transferase [Candidatus Acidoferrales bacterium]
MPPITGPLAGIRVLDLSAYIAGPYGCSLLADLGAEVIKVEPPAGDTLRQYPSTLEPEARAFLGTNRSKLGIVLDLKQAEGQQAIHRLVADADVLVHNFRPSAPPRLGLEYERLRKLNPRLIYCALTGYGDTGPLRDKAGYDQVLQSTTGICTLQGPPGKPEIVLGSIVDFYAASQLAFAVTAALFYRERTGKGQYVGVSLLGSALAMQSGRFIWAGKEGRDVGRDLRSGGITAIHPTKDGFIYISANTPHFWQSLCELVGLPELAQDPNYDTVRKRAQRAAEIVPKIRAALQSGTALEWEERFGDRVPCGVVRPIEDMFDHPQVLAEGLVATFEHKTVGQYRGVAKPIKLSESPAPEPFAAPALGQHTAEVLTRLGYSAEMLERLRKLKVIPE